VPDALSAGLAVIHDPPLPLQRNTLVRGLLRELMGTLQEVVAADKALGFVSLGGSGSSGGRCIVVYPRPSGEARHAEGREYFRG
jgi:hypothetical protein